MKLVTITVDETCHVMKITTGETCDVMKITADGTCQVKKIIVDESRCDVGLFNAMNMLLLARHSRQRE